MRKVLLVLAAAGAVAVPTTVALGDDGSANQPAVTAAPAAGRDATTQVQIARKLAKRAGTDGDRRVEMLRGLAGRLGVSTDELVIAGRTAAVKALETVGAQSDVETRALRACVGRADACDRAAARRQARRLHRTVDVSKLDLAALKQQLAADVAEGLATDPATVLDAVRAELESKLKFAQVIGFVTPAQRELALGCFDDPAACDVDALRRAFRSTHRG